MRQQPRDRLLRFLREEPYRLLFPLSVLLAWAGVLHWGLHAVGTFAEYRSVFHAIVQVQGFITCLALGFLLTAVPRLTTTSSPSAGMVAAAATLPVGSSVAAWFDLLAISQICWGALLVMLAGFLGSRWSAITRRGLNSFVWIPAAMFMALIGSLMTGGPALLGEEYFWVHQLGQLIVLQGFPLALVAGAGTVVLPLITRGETPPHGQSGTRGRVARLGHLTAASVLAGSFWIEIDSARLGLGLRAAVMAVVLVGAAGIWRPPKRPGAHRWLVWASAWLIPAGYTLAALFPIEKKAGMHVAFIGGLGLMGLSVALHVTLAHAGEPNAAAGRYWQVPLLGSLMLASLSFRALVDFDPAQFFLWNGLSAATFLVGSLFWCWLAVPRALRRPLS